MKPYYENPSITIYHGDSREIVPTLGPVDAVVTDPPYGISLPTNYGERGRGAAKRAAGSWTLSGEPPESRNYPAVKGDDQPFDPAHILALNVPTVLWGANYYADKLPPTGGWLVWEKMRPEGVDQADAELAWTNFVAGCRTFAHMWNGFQRHSEHGTGYHPTQKPVALFVWTYQLPWFPAGLILDPYTGSGPALVAAQRLGRRAIGIELEERYCEIAARRCGDLSRADESEPLLGLMLATPASPKTENPKPKTTPVRVRKPNAQRKPTA